MELRTGSAPSFMDQSVSPVKMHATVALIRIRTLITDDGDESGPD